MRRMMEVVIVYGYLENADALSELLFLFAFPQRRGNEVDLQPWHPCEALQQRMIDGPRATAQRWELIVEHQDAHGRSTPIPRDPAHYVERAPLHLVENPADVFAHNTDGDELDTGQEEDGYYQRGEAWRTQAGCQLLDRIETSQQKGEQGDAQPKQRSHAQWCMRE